jgi:hypothetical protein
LRTGRRRAIAAGLVVVVAGVAGGVIVSGGDDAVDDPVDALAAGEITTVLGDGGEIDETGAPGVETGIGPVTFVAIGADGTFGRQGSTAVCSHWPTGAPSTPPASSVPPPGWSPTVSPC